MFNLFRMEGTRLRKSKYPYIMIVILVLSLSLALVGLDVALKQMDLPKEEVQAETQEGLTIEFDASEKEMKSEDGEEVFLLPSNEFVLLTLTTVFASIYFTAPYSHGFIKNFLGMQDKKEKYVIASYLQACLYVLTLFLFAGVFMYFGLPWVKDGFFSISSYSKVLQIMAIQLIPHFSFLSVILLIATVTRSLPITLTTSILYQTIFFRPVIGLLDTLLQKVVSFEEGFSLAFLTNRGNIERIGLASSQNDLVVSILVALVISFVALFLSSVIIRKKDI